MQLDHSDKPPYSGDRMMRDGAFRFSGKWADVLQNLGETGMGYTVASVTLRDGCTFDQVVIDSGWLARVRGLPDIPFSEADIAAIKANHQKWDWDEKP